MISTKPAVAELPRTLGLLDSASIVIGIVIGAGIFLVPRMVAQALPSAPLIVGAWIACGVLCFFGGLAYAELGAMMPETGGHYVYLRECYGPLAGFLCGWTFTLVVMWAAIAWLAVSFSITLAYFVPLSALASKSISVLLIAVFSVVNYRGVRLSAGVQKLLTALKVAGLCIIVGSAFVPGHGTAGNHWTLPRGAFSWAALGAAMVPIVLCYDGWPAISHVAGEIRDPHRNIPRSLGLGIAAVAAIYCLANIAYLRVLPVSLIAGADRTAAVVAERTLGRSGGAILSITILFSIAAAINGFVMTVPRLCFAMARDGLLFRSLAAIHPRFRTLSVGIIVQSIWAAVLVLTGSFETLVPYAMIAAWFFYGLTATAVMVLRRKYPLRPRPYRMWGYPVTPLLFITVSAWFVANTWITQPGPSTIAFLIIAAGIPVYFLWRRLAS